MNKSNLFKNKDNSIKHNKKIMPVKRYTSYKEKLMRKIFITLLLIAITITFFIISINTKIKVLLSYTEKSHLDYFVYLKENNYYEKPYLGKGMQYIASLIDYIDVKFNYNFKVNESIDYTYKYYIEADIKVFEKNNQSNIIFQKKTKLVEDTIYSNASSPDFNIHKFLKIDYSEYNDLVRDFKTSYNITADSNLKLTLYIEVDGIYESFETPIKASNAIELVIPLSEQMINIKMDYNEINKSDNFKGTSNNKLINYIYLGVSLFFLLLAIASIFNLFKFLRRTKNKKTLYQKRISSILREYDHVIIEVRKPFDFSDKQTVFEVKTFEELLDASDKLGTPILFMEIHKNQKSYFIVKHNADIYRYVLKEANLERGENQ